MAKLGMAVNPGEISEGAGWAGCMSADPVSSGWRSGLEDRALRNQAPEVHTGVM